MRGIKEVQFRPTDVDRDKDLPTFDNTKLTAINTCPTWGLLRYEHHKAMPGAGRAMALEAGSAMHDVFAAVRLWQLRFVQGHTDLFEYHGKRLFGPQRWERMTEFLVTDGGDETERLNFCLEALYTNGFHDDPGDRRRTVRNLEECAIRYIAEYEWTRRPVWVRAPHDPTSDVGIEVPFDIVITFIFENEDEFSIRFVGKMDGVHVEDDETVVIEENKTASRLGDAWMQSFEMSSQVTGYAMAIALWVQQPVNKAIVRGVAIPLPKTYDYGGVVAVPVKREQHHFEHWLNWVRHTVFEVWLPYKDDVIHAPRYTHSCNRYFRPCSMLPFCAVPDDEKEQVLSEMEYKPWSPLHEEHESSE